MQKNNLTDKIADLFDESLSDKDKKLLINGINEIPETDDLGKSSCDHLNCIFTGIYKVQGYSH